MSINPDNLLSSPTAVTSIVTGPRDSVNPACNSSPFATSTGTDSPVRGARLTEPEPEIIFHQQESVPHSQSLDGLPHDQSNRNFFGPCILVRTWSHEILLRHNRYGRNRKCTNSHFGTLLAVLGKRSRPPCIAFLAFIRASFSMCSVHDTKIKTNNASSQCLQI